MLEATPWYVPVSLACLVLVFAYLGVLAIMTWLKAGAWQAFVWWLEQITIEED